MCFLINLKWSKMSWNFAHEINHLPVNFMFSYVPKCMYVHLGFQKFSGVTPRTPFSCEDHPVPLAPISQFDYCIYI